MSKYDVIVVGAGHAGLEAAFSTANAGLNVALITLKEKSIGCCPCNPSVGGPAKGIVTREIDALGGMQGIAADINQMQMKLLNESKGAGVRALRAQIDKIKYQQWFIKQIRKNKNITLIIDEVSELIIKNKEINGVKLRSGVFINAKCVIITSGTYMEAKTFSGYAFKDSGPIFDYKDTKHQIKTETAPNTFLLAQNIKKLGFETIRLKTGTPPRIYKDSIDYTKLEKQPGSKEKLAFEHFKPTYIPYKKQCLCWMTYTSARTHKIIKDNIKLSPMYGGIIKSIGPRYCPSIEDKVMRFSDKPRHQLFIEPESNLMDTMYLQGFSTTLPESIQDKIVHTLPGFKNCKIQRYAYAIEYDAIDPTQLWPTLETKKIGGLFFAGQINGTSGYEEAAGQGLLAGINAILKIKRKKPLILNRDESYIGVMIDDIVTKGVTDPYRLLTSRAEHRLHLRNDNADERLMKYGYEIGLVKKDKYTNFLNQQKIIENVIAILKKTSLSKPLFKKYGSSNHNLFQLLKRPDVRLKDIYKAKIDAFIAYKIETKVKFEGYIISQNKIIDKYNKINNIELKLIKNYKLVHNLSLEAIDKLNKIKPLTLSQAQRISGITSNDIIAIKLYLDDLNVKK